MASHKTDTILNPYNKIENIILNRVFILENENA